MEINNNLFISNNLKIFIEQLYDLYKNNNNFKIQYINFELYNELIIFIENVKNFLIIENYNSIKKDIKLIISSDDSVEIKNDKILKYLMSINYGIFSDIVFNIIIDINNYINENKELKFDKEIELLIEKYFKNEKNYEKYNEIKKILKNNNETYDLFFKFFNNIEFDEKIFTNNPTIINNITKTSMFCLKKENGKIILLEIFNIMDIKIIVSENEINKYKETKKNKKKIIEKDNPEIVKIVTKLAKNLDDMFDIEIINDKIKINGYKNNNKKSQIGGNILLTLINILLNTLIGFVALLYGLIFYFSTKYYDNIVDYWQNMFDNVTSKTNNIISYLGFTTMFTPWEAVNIVSKIYYLNTGIFIVSTLYFTYPIIIKLSKMIFNALKDIYIYLYNKIYNKIYNKNIKSESKNNIKGGSINNNYFIIPNLKKNIENILISFKIDNTDIIPINNIKPYYETTAMSYIILFTNKLECISKTNLFRNKKITNNITEIWNNTNKELKLPNILITPNYFQILNNQYGGDIDYKNINNEKIKMKCYSNINYLLKKTLSKIDKNIIDNILIEEINKKIDIADKNEIILEKFFEKNLIDNKIINNTELKEYKKLFEETNKLYNKLYIILFEIIKNY